MHGRCLTAYPFRWGNTGGIHTPQRDKAKARYHCNTCNETERIGFARWPGDCRKRIALRKIDDLCIGVVPRIDIVGNIFIARLLFGQSHGKAHRLLPFRSEGRANAR